MVPLVPREFLPVELVFNPNWWHHAAGISFDRSFYLDPEARIDNDLKMRRVLYERFGQMGLGEPDPQPRPIIGSVHVAGGFVIPALLGAEIWFEPDAAPQPLPVGLTPEQVEKLEKPDFRATWPMNELIAQMDQLEAEWGYVVGDLNTDGVLNAAYHLYGQAVYTDFYEAPERARRLMDLIAELIGDVAGYIQSRTGSYSISVNRMAEHFTPSPFLHANCSVQMISPTSYREIQFPAEKRLAERLQPFGVHHCGNNLHRIAPEYAALPAAYFEVGWGSDVALSLQALPHAFMNLRLNPVRFLQETPAAIAADTEKVLSAAAAANALGRVGVCCINMDHETPDENIFAMYEVVQAYRRYGGNR
jgi:uroporphyrinogen-III decarboxylase